MVGSGVVPSFVLHIFLSLLVLVGWRSGCGLKVSLDGLYDVLFLGCLLFVVGFL
jgi:hypothetical protein